MPNIPYPVGAELAVRLTHLFEIKDSNCGWRRREH